ncbi:unnamed protein product [Chrysoparadoxa australica]
MEVAQFIMSVIEGRKETDPAEMKLMLEGFIGESDTWIDALLAVDGTARGAMEGLVSALGIDTSSSSACTEWLTKAKESLDEQVAALTAAGAESGEANTEKDPSAPSATKHALKAYDGSIIAQGPDAELGGSNKGGIKGGESGADDFLMRYGALQLGDQAPTHQNHSISAPAPVFVPPFPLPSGVIAPTTKEAHEIMKKVASQSVGLASEPNMELYLRMKRVRVPQAATGCASQDCDLFLFIESNHPLHRYYLLLKEKERELKLALPSQQTTKQKVHSKGPAVDEELNELKALLYGA